MAGLFGKKPEPKATVQMPDENDQNVVAERRRQYQLAQSRSGQASTILSDDFSRDRLGGGL